MKLETGIFSGLTIASFSWAIVGPLTMKFFADYGATVIRVETSKRPCTLRISNPYYNAVPGLDNSGYFNHFSANTLSLAINMEHPQARFVIDRLISKSDVFMENFTPGVIEKWGLDYESLCKIKPDIIMLRQSGFGSKGPYSRQPAFGMILAAMAGIPNFIGWPDRGPLPIGVSAYTDCISPRFAAAALIAALDRRNKTGHGQLIDISQFETALSFILPGLLDYAANGREPGRVGNASPEAAPHGVYPCRPDVESKTGKPDNDRWCTISITTDRQWSSLCEAMNRPDLKDDVRFSTLLNRKKHEQELDGIVGRWTVVHSAEEIMESLQAAAIPAGVVKNVADVRSDPQLNQRGLFWQLEHPVMGQFTHLGQSFVMSRTPAQARSPSPCLGEHTEYICTKLLGMKDEEFAALASSGVFE